MRSSFAYAFVLVLLAVLGAAPAWADEGDVPPPPPPPDELSIYPPAMPEPPPPVVVDEAVPMAPEMTGASFDASARAVGGLCGVEAVCPPCRPNCGVWIRLEGLAAYIDGPQGLFGPPTGNPAQVSWDDIEYDPEVAFGGRLTIGVRHPTGWRYFFAAMCTGGWEGTSTQTGVIGARQTPGGPVVTSPTRTATIESEAILWSGEVHAWRTICDRKCVDFDLGFGMRYSAFDEDLRVGVRVTNPGPTGQPWMEANVDNRYVFGQLGAMLTWSPTRRLSFYGSAKGLAGLADRRVRINDNSVFVGGLHGSRLDDNTFGWGVDAEVGVEFFLTPHWSLNLGYQFLWLDPVVRAHDALDLTQGATGAVQARAVDDDLMAHLVYFGVTWMQ